MGMAASMLLFARLAGGAAAAAAAAAAATDTCGIKTSTEAAASHTSAAFDTAKKAAAVAASAAVAAFHKVVEAAKTVMDYISNLCCGAAASSAYEAVKATALAVRGSILSLLNSFFGAEAAAAAKRKLYEAVSRAARVTSGGTLRLSSQPPRATVKSVVSAGKAVRLARLFVSPVAAKFAGSGVADMMSLVERIPSLGFPIPMEAKIMIVMIAVASGVGLALFMAGVTAGAMMKAPGGCGAFILRSAFEANPKDYFRILRADGPAAAVSRFA